MAPSQNSTPTPPPSSRDTLLDIARHSTATNLILADILATQLRSHPTLTPTKSGQKTPWQSIPASIKSAVDYIAAVHKAVLLWRAISLGYIGRELLRWAGWL
jgi:hypothetical protein